MISSLHNPRGENPHSDAGQWLAAYLGQRRRTNEDGSLLATLGADGDHSIGVYDWGQGELRAKTLGHKNKVKSRHKATQSHSKSHKVTQSGGGVWCVVCGVWCVVFPSAASM